MRSLLLRRPLTPPGPFLMLLVLVLLTPLTRTAHAAGPTDSWTATGSLTTARYQHRATLLPSGQVLVVAGDLDTSVPSAELYDSGA